MKFNKIAFVLAGVMAVGCFSGCGGSGNVYKSEDGSLTINLPSEVWTPLAEGEEENGGAYAFQVSGDAENTDPLYVSDDENSLSQNIIIFQSMSADEGTLAYDSIPTSEDELKESLGDTFEYEIVDFDGSDDDGTKSNLYVVKVPSTDTSVEDSEDATGEAEEEVKTSSYVIARTKADSENGFIIAAQLIIKNDGDSDSIGKDGEETIESVKKSLQSVKYDADKKAVAEEAETDTESIGETTTEAE